MNILDELERLEGDGLYDGDRDAVGSFGYLTERGEMVEKALPALIRVARAAEELLLKTYPSSKAAAGHLLKLEEVLQQLRALGEDDEGARDLEGNK